MIQRRGGFTLLEVLLAAVLSGVVMFGVWTLFNTYERLFSKGQMKVERSQLVRSLLEQISDDLKSAIPDTATGLPGASSSIRRFGLFGTERSLRVDVLQVVPTQIAKPSEGREEDQFGREKQSRPQVPELHTVEYSLHSTQTMEPMAELKTEGAAQGLVRRELDWETPNSGQSSGSQLSSPSSDLPSTPAPRRSRRRVSATESESANKPALSKDAGAEAGKPEDESVLQVPEVVSLEFRYYDGSNWTGQWNSLERKSLPVAIEVRLKLKAPEDVSRRPAQKSETGQPLEAKLSPMGDKETSGESYRMVVVLPSTALARQAKSRSERRREALEVRAAAPVVLVPSSPPPRVGVPRRSLGEGARGQGAGPNSLPDQWMRSGK